MKFPNFWGGALPPPPAPPCCSSTAYHHNKTVEKSSYFIPINVLFVHILYCIKNEKNTKDTHMIKIIQLKIIMKVTLFKDVNIISSHIKMSDYGVGNVSDNDMIRISEINDLIVYLNRKLFVHKGSFVDINVVVVCGILMLK